MSEAAHGVPVTESKISPHEATDSLAELKLEYVKIDWLRRYIHQLSYCVIRSPIISFHMQNFMLLDYLYM
jgi:hypothetical protein